MSEWRARTDAPCAHTLTSSLATITLSSGSGNITLHGTVDGAFALTLNSAGTTAIHSAVGGSTPLHRVKTVDMAELLLERDADPNIANFAGATPLHNASGEGNDLRIFRGVGR